MELSTRVNSGYNICELTIKSENTTINEDLSTYKADGKYYVPQKIIEEFFNAGFDLNRFNDKSDVDTIKMIFDNFLSDNDKAQFIEIINSIPCT